MDKIFIKELFIIARKKETDYLNTQQYQNG